MDTAVITLTIPSVWLEGIAPTPDELQRALKLGLDQLRQQQTAQDSTRVVHALLRTGRISRLPLPADAAQDDANSVRQPPPTLPGPALSDILIAQRRGEQ